MLRLCSLIGLAGAPFWQNFWSLGAPFVVSDCVFFAKRTRRQGQPKLANFTVGRLSPKGVFRHLSWCSVWSFLVPLLVLRVWPLLVLFFFEFYFALLHQSTLNNARFTGMSFGV